MYEILFVLTIFLLIALIVIFVYVSLSEDIFDILIPRIDTKVETKANIVVDYIKTKIGVVPDHNMTGNYNFMAELPYLFTTKIPENTQNTVVSYIQNSNIRTLEKVRGETEGRIGNLGSKTVGAESIPIAHTVKSYTDDKIGTLGAIGDGTGGSASATAYIDEQIGTLGTNADDSATQYTDGEIAGYDNSTPDNIQIGTGTSSSQTIGLIDNVTVENKHFQICNETSPKICYKFVVDVTGNLNIIQTSGGNVNTGNINIGKNKIYANEYHKFDAIGDVDINTNDEKSLTTLLLNNLNHYHKSTWDGNGTKPDNDIINGI